MSLIDRIRTRALITSELPFSSTGCALLSYCQPDHSYHQRISGVVAYLVDIVITGTEKQQTG